MTTPSNGIPFVPENTLDPAAGLNLSLNAIDVLLQLAVISLGENSPPGSPANGDRHIVGASPTAEWTGEANRIARYIEEGGFWQFYDARIALNLGDGALYKFTGGQWTELTSTTGIETFIGQTDTPAAYTDEEGKLVIVNATGDGLVFAELLVLLLGGLAEGDEGKTVVVNETFDGLTLQDPEPEPSKGDTASRPADPKIGFIYFDTDLAVAGQPIWWTGTDWVDAQGVIV